MKRLLLILNSGILRLLLRTAQEKAHAKGIPAGEKMFCWSLMHQGKSSVKSYMNENKLYTSIRKRKNAERQSDMYKNYVRPIESMNEGFDRRKRIRLIIYLC